jgi:putative protease
VVKDKDSEIEIEIDNEYIMSAKDLKTIHFMNKMLDAGVRVFKIEGRARGAEYVRIVTACYKEAIQAYCSNTFLQEKIEVWNEQLATVFNRGFWDGYYLGQRLGEWTHQYGSGATKRKVYVGKALKHFGKLGVTEFLVETQSIKQGDELLITGPSTGAIFLTADDIRVNLQTVPEAVKGDRFSIKTPEKIRPNDQLYKMVKAERKGTAHER